MDRVREPLPTHVDETPALPTEYGVVLDAGLLALGLDLPPAARAGVIHDFGAARRFVDNFR